MLKDKEIILRAYQNDGMTGVIQGEKCEDKSFESGSNLEVLRDMVEAVHTSRSVDRTLALRGYLLSGEAGLNRTEVFAQVSHGKERISNIIL